MARRLTGGERRKVSQSVRFTVEEWLKITKAARKSHLSVSDYIRSNIPGTQVSHYFRHLK